MFGLLDENNVLIQKQPNEQEGFVSIPNDAVCGQILENGEFVNPPAHRSIASADAKSLIDVAAGGARSSFIADGELVEQEYALAEQEVIAWREAGSPSGAVPQSVSAWAEATGMSDEQAAQGIETAAESLKGVLLSIRAIRLAGKAAIDNASVNFDAVAQPFIDQLDQIRP